MSSVAHNEVGPVIDCADGSHPRVHAFAGRLELKTAAIHELHRIHKENQVHKFEETVKDQHIEAWKVVQFREEKTAYGLNFFLKVYIAPHHYLHVRIHRQQHHEIYDFYSLHNTIKHNVETCIFSEKDTLEYFNA